MQPLPDLPDWPDPVAAALLFAVDPHGLGGLVVRGATPLRDAYVSAIRDLLPPVLPWRRLPISVTNERLDGGLDLATTLANGRPVMQAGLLTACDGGVLVVPTAERLPIATTARLVAALDTGRSAQGTGAARFGVIAFDDGMEDEALPAALADRLAFHVVAGAPSPLQDRAIAPDWIAQARRLAPEIAVDEDVLRAVAATAASLGITSLRPALATLRAARIAAALAGRQAVTPADAGLAGRLVLAPRAIQAPAAVEPPGRDPEASAASQGDHGSDPDGRAETGGAVEETVREAVRSALPPGLLERLAAGTRPNRPVPGRAGAAQAGKSRGRPAGQRRGLPGSGAPLNLIETLRAAAPWQALRRSAAKPRRGDRLIEIRRDDFRLTRFKQRSETVTLFAVDASGSLALQRLNEAKGAVELLLAECYVRRDQVALLSFRGTGADVLLPPTRSLARAKRCLASLAGGGPTPLATALEAATRLADGIRRRGRTPTLVLFTDGRANVTRGGAIDRVRAQAESDQAARAAASTGLRVLLVDAAPRPQAAARALATAMNATYLPLPRADAAGLTRAIRQAAPD